MTQHKCVRCGAELPAETPGGHCPLCLVTVALSPSPETTRGTTFSLPRQCGGYELLDEIARGGMGIVFRARQIGLDRIVALKMVLAGEFASAEALDRFRREARAAARLQHPNIVSIHEIGEWEGQAYFTMDLVDGHTLAETARDQGLTPREAARQLSVISRAVQFAHDRGILHRDLKPSNIIIDRAGEPHVTDFGLAGPLDHDQGLTITGQTLGSPGYISPEQAFGDHSAIGPASDVYALGAILYHLLTGRAPFQGGTLHDVLLQVKTAEPVLPRRLNAGVPLDLETVCLKCLEKEPARRYATAAELADELERFLKHEPIRARPLGPVAKIWRWCRRRPAIASLSASVLLLLTIVAISSTMAAVRVSNARLAEQRARQNTEAANSDLRDANTRLAHSVSLLELQRAEDLFRGNDAAMGVAHLAAMLRRDPSNSIAANRLVSALVHRNWALPASPTMWHRERIPAVCFSPDGKQILSGSKDGTARIWDPATGRCLAVLPHEGPVQTAKYSHSGRAVVTASLDGTARVWDAGGGMQISPPLIHTSQVWWAEFSPDDRFVITASGASTPGNGFPSPEFSACLWDAQSGARLREFQNGSLVRFALFTPDGQRVVTATESGSIRIWSVDSTNALLTLPAPRSRVETLAISPDGKRLVSGHSNGVAQLWDMRTGARVGPVLLHKDMVLHAAFSPDSSRLLTCSQDNTARLWNAVDGGSIGLPLAHDAAVRFGDFSPDGQLVVTTCLDITARVWDARTGTPYCQPLRHREQLIQAGFSPDGLRLVTASFDWTIQVWDVEPRNSAGLVVRQKGDVTSVHFTPDGKSFLTTSQSGIAQFWGTAGGEPIGSPFSHETGIRSGDLSADGTRVATGDARGVGQIWDVKNHAVLARVTHRDRIHSIRFNQDSTRVVTASDDGTARVWNADTGAVVGAPLKHDARVLCAVFSPDGRFVITASDDNSARIWNAQTGAPLTDRLSHIDHLRWAEFSPDGQRVVTASVDNHAGIWDAHSGRLTAPPLQHTRIVEHACFSPDGKRVATASFDRTARIWNSTNGQALTPPLRHEHAVSKVCFSPDGTRILTTSWGGLARVWDSETGRPLTEWLPVGSWYIFDACFDKRGDRVVAGGQSGLTRLWRLPQAPTPVPAWLPAFAESIAGIRLSNRGNVEIVDHAELEAATKQSHSAGSSDFYEKLAAWFFADAAKRPIEPF